jgi:hypothetical protein
MFLNFYFLFTFLVIFAIILWTAKKKEKIEELDPEILEEKLFKIDNNLKDEPKKLLAKGLELDEREKLIEEKEKLITKAIQEQKKLLNF